VFNQLNRARLPLLALGRVNEALDVCTRAGEGVARDAGRGIQDVACAR